MEEFHNWVKYVQWAHVLVDAPTPPPLVVPLLVALPLAELMLGIVVAPLGATIPLVIET
jgi:hypothetical protein